MILRRIEDPELFLADSISYPSTAEHVHVAVEQTTTLPALVRTCTRRALTAPNSEKQTRSARFCFFDPCLSGWSPHWACRCRCIGAHRQTTTSL